MVKANVTRTKEDRERDIVRLLIDRANSILSLVNMYQGDRDFKDLIAYASDDVDNLKDAINDGYDLIYTDVHPLYKEGE